MKAVLALSLITLTISQSTAQLFPFSNLRHYFEHQTKNAGGNVVTQTQNSEQSTGRPYRHTEAQNVKKILDLPSIPSFGPGDIFSRDGKDDRTERPYRHADSRNEGTTDSHSTPDFGPGDVFERPKEIEKQSTKREDSFQEDKTVEHSQTKRRRKPVRSNQGSREYTSQKPEHRDRSETILVTPKPIYRVNKQHDEQGNDDRSYIKSTSSKSNDYESFTPTEETSRIARPVHYGSMQINTNEEPILVNLAPKKIQTDRIESSSELTFPSKDPILVESVPSLHFAVEQTQYRPDPSGLVDYLTPPRLPSVYGSADELNPEDFYGSDDDATSRLSKLKPPPPVKKMKYRIKKYRVKPTHGPPRPVRNRKPKELASTVRPTGYPDKITVENVDDDGGAHAGSSKGKTARQAAMEHAGSQLDEQITAETGFTGVAAATHGSDQRVEFQMHGQNGPESYKFGYDTGKGHNRQFRFEEKDNHGHVKGHYGYYDKTGKLQVVNYEADPEHGFKADSV